MERTVTRHAIRLAQIQPRSPLRTTCKPSPQQHIRYHSNDTKKDNQVYPLTGYYADILSSRQPPTTSPPDPPTSEPQPQPSTTTTPTPPLATSLSKTKEETLAKARIVFGSSGSSRRDPKDSSLAKEIFGIKVPPKPAEPSGDDCCMSGCVNCVWDIYREEFEEWKALSKQAREKMEAAAKPGGVVAGEGGSMDDDGGGSEALWMEGSDKEEQEEKDPFADVPVGIREFMRTEKMLKERQAAQQASKG
ncbi:hypothetical protein E4T50_03708 [Aureobasidium sp. EXF-12298]|jgi:hypothetical protein|nr:hypothetical protein E4T50_03708 [Aureobasidium sp. EXF-12298]